MHAMILRCNKWTTKGEEDDSSEAFRTGASVAQWAHHRVTRQAGGLVEELSWHVVILVR